MCSDLNILPLNWPEEDYKQQLAAVLPDYPKVKLYKRQAKKAVKKAAEVLCAVSALALWCVACYMITAAWLG